MEPFSSHRHLSKALISTLSAGLLLLPGGGERGNLQAQIPPEDGAETLRPSAPRNWEKQLSAADILAFESSYKQGLLWMDQGRFKDAVQSFGVCLKLRPDHYGARFTLGQCHLRIGQYDQAEKTLRLAAGKHPDQPAPRYFLGVTRMRMGRFKDAVRPLKEAIDRAPAFDGANWNLLKANWNLMIACKYAGENAKRLKKRYQMPLAPDIPPSHEPVRFADVGVQAGVARVNMGRGSAWRDLNDDGWLDLFTVAEGGVHTLYRSNGNGTFTDIARQAGVADSLGGWSALWIDYDNDGAPDLFITRNGWKGVGKDTLYRNNGDGTFADVTGQAGLGEMADSFCAAWGDYDNDGGVDLYVARGISQKGHPNALYRNNGDGTFTDVARQARVHNGNRPTIGAVWGDYDGDGWLDLYAANYEAPNTLYRNNGDGTFTDVTTAADVADPHRGFVAFFFDYNNDARLDLFVSSWTGRMEEVIQSMVTGEPATPGNRPFLYRNNGDGTFTDVTREAGLARTFGTMAATYGDVDNDGYQDIYLANGGPDIDRFEPDRLFLNNGDGTFSDITEAAGLGNIGKGHGPTMADYDNDGDLDVYAPQGGMGGNPGDNQPNSLYRNEGNRNHWLKVRVIGAAQPQTEAGSPAQRNTFSNRDGIGAGVRIKVGGKAQYAEVSGGCGFGVTNSLSLSFGLGEATQVDTVEIRWPSGRIHRLANVPADTSLIIRELEIDNRQFLGFEKPASSL